MYRSAAYLDEFHSRISTAVQKISDDYEIIFVNDGSPDNSYQKALELRGKDPKVKVVNFSRNFGHHKAILTGLSYTSGDYVFLIDCDLEEDPELLNEFYDELCAEEDLDMLFGVQAIRKGGFFEKITGYIWYKFFNFMTDTKLPENLLTVRIMKQNLVKNLVKFTEKEPNFSTLVELNGFNNKTKLVHKKDKHSTTYNLMRKLDIAINTITSSSIFPLWLIFYLGLGIVSISSLIISYLFYKKLILGIDIEGWTSIMTVTIFFGGLIVFVLGVIGIYVSKILGEVKERPYTVVKSTHGF